MALTLRHLRTVTPAITWVNVETVSAPTHNSLCLDHAGNLYTAPFSSGAVEMCKVNPVTGAQIGSVVISTLLSQCNSVATINATRAIIGTEGGNLVRIVMAAPDSLLEGCNACLPNGDFTFDIYGSDILGTTVYAASSPLLKVLRYVNLEAGLTDLIPNINADEATLLPWLDGQTGDPTGNLRRLTNGNFLFCIRQPLGGPTSAEFVETDSAFGFIKRTTFSGLLGPGFGTGGLGGGLYGLAVDEPNGLVYAQSEQGQLYTFQILPAGSLSQRSEPVPASSLRKLYSFVRSKPSRRKFRPRFGL